MAETTEEKSEQKPEEKMLKRFQQGSKTKYYSGTGRRKRAVAQVRLIKGKGDVFVNGMELSKYFASDKFSEKFILYPLELTGNEKKFDISVLVFGGGKLAQKEAIRLGIARALIKFDETLRTTLKKSDLLTRDPREKERKKYGLKKARKAPQWAKR